MFIIMQKPFATYSIQDLAQITSKLLPFVKHPTQAQPVPSVSCLYHECKGCPLTCENYDKPVPCQLICAPGCACPYGQVINEQTNTCVSPEHVVNHPRSISLS